MSAHVRPTVAKWFGDLSLSSRLTLSIALIVIAVVSSVAYLEVRSLERNIEGELGDAARLAALAAADDMASLGPTLDPEDVRDALHDLVDADPQIDGIAVIEADDAGHVRVFASTSTEERTEILDLAARAIAARSPTDDRSGTDVMFAMPVPKRPNLAVAARVGLEGLLQARAHALRIALGFAVPTVLLVTLLVHITVRQFLGQPLAAIVRVMARTAAGDLGARTTIARKDELGTIAARLNDMLDQLERFHRSLQQRVEEATRDLSLRNAQLAASQSELFALRESLARAERVAALGQVAANVAHQAGTPLNLVSGYVQMIRDDPRTDDRVRARLRTVDAQIQQVTRVLRTMLDHARQPAGFEVVALAGIIERVREVAQPRLSRSSITLQTSIARDLPPIKADPTQLEMALLNLVTNALDAMPGGGALSMTAAPVPDGIRIEIADTGSGIPAEIVDRLFDPWVTTKPAGQGTGLGLAIIRDVIRAHGGSISVSSQSTGTAFVIDLPAARADRSVA